MPAYNIDGMNKEHEQFKQLFEQHFPQLVVYARRFVDSTDIAEDLAQNALVQMWVERNKGVAVRDIVAFLRSIVRRRALNMIEHDRVAHDVHNEIGNAVDAGLAIDPESQFLKDEVARVVWAAIDKLPPRARAAATMRWVDGMSRPDIAAEMGVSVRTVNEQLTRAAKRVREVLEPFR